MIQRRRSDLPELMDQPDVPEEDLDQALQELQTINRWLGGHRTTRQGISRLIRDIPADRVITVLDIGAGGTDLKEVLRPLHRQFSVTALDVNPHMQTYAVRHHHAVRVDTGSAHALPYPAQSFDIVHASLFLHHCTDEEAFTLLKRASRIARFGVVVNDLHRHPLALAGIALLTALFGRSPIVRNDARISVQRGFTRNEVRILLSRAQINDATLSWHWAFRWCLLFRAAQGEFDG